jgi:hypothetical protein
MYSPRFTDEEAEAPGVGAFAHGQVHSMWQSQNSNQGPVAFQHCMLSLWNVQNGHSPALPNLTV